MENDSNVNNSQTTGMHGRIHRAVNACPALRAIRRISPGSRRTSPATDSPPERRTKDPPKHDKSSKETNPRQTPGSGETIPILFDYSNYSAPNEKPKSAIPVPLERSSEGYKSGTHIEDRFTDYIKRAKIKIRTTSNVGDRKEASVNDKVTKLNAGDHKMELSANDHFTNYIRRTGAKIRINSSIGDHGNSR